MEDATIQKINSAAQQCLHHCYQCDTPLVCVATFMQRLRSDPTWNEREVEHVEIAVLKVLHVLVEQSSDEESVTRGAPLPAHVLLHSIAWR
jgi:hypothetical protein